MKKNTNKKDLFGKANYNEQLTSLIKIAVGVVLVLVIVYFATAFATGEIELGSKEKKKEESTIQYEEIIAGQVMSRIEDEYYVLLFNFTDTDSSYYLSLKDSYSQNIDALSFYIVDLEKGFNQSIVAGEDEEYNNKPTRIKDLKVKSPTLLRIKNKKVVERVEENEKVLEKLEDLAN